MDINNLQVQDLITVAILAICCTAVVCYLIDGAREDRREALIVRAHERIVALRAENTRLNDEYRTLQSSHLELARDLGVPSVRSAKDYTFDDHVLDAMAVANGMGS